MGMYALVGALVCEEAVCVTGKGEGDGVRGLARVRCVKRTSCVACMAK